jgi:hypothetical protein
MVHFRVSGLGFRGSGLGFRVGRAEGAETRLEWYTVPEMYLTAARSAALPTRRESLLKYVTQDGVVFSPDCVGAGRARARD